MAGRVAVDASALYSRNLYNFLQPLIDEETKALKLDWEDEILKAVVLTREGKIAHPDFAGAKAAKPKTAKPKTAKPKTAKPKTAKKGK